ncbi:MAG TPA: 2-oxo acid dehydrogenase subunit E2 [Bacteroidetes bacterium]|nr:dihydrolipoyllysine-residue acetyltransferase component of pyruvate dehydrogenase complex [bacterium BMS3Bbin04]HDO65452.1 2-oxo acid dehydrogenase subunit E2 [Bacteroidota bacterium]HEX04577.1 2-oxo acid dehydrogenase subunit E2 [Bacteroidota bacterium]
MNEFRLPDLGEGIHEGELLKWYVKVGDEIKEDEPLCDVETDKAAVTIPSPFTGKVIALNGNVGDTLHLDEVIAVVGADGDVAVAQAAPAKEAKVEVASAPATVAATVATPAIAAPAAGGNGTRAIAAPATRRLAREMDLDINVIKGSGPAGRVTADDVLRYNDSPASPAEIGTAVDSSAEAVGTGNIDFSNASIPFFEVAKLPDFEQFGPVEREPVRSIRRKVAILTTSSTIIVPHVAHMDECDVTDLDSLRQKQNELSRGSDAPKLTLMPFVVRAVSSMLKKYPMFNASLDPHRQEIIYKKYYNVGFAADTPRGLIVPVIKDSDRKSIRDIAAEILTLAGKGRDGTIDAAEMRNGTFSITNVGPIGGTGMVATINYPEVAILGMGRVQEKPVVRDGEIVIRKMLPLSLAFDHRVADGAQAAHFTTDLIALLSDPDRLLLDS